MTDTPTDKLNAASEIATLTNELRDSNRPHGDPFRTSRVEQIVELQRSLRAEEPPAPTAPTWREQREHRKTVAEMRAELLTLPEGSEQHRAVLDEIVNAEREFMARMPAAPERVTWEHVDRTPSAQSWSPAERERFMLWGQTAGVTPIEAVELAGMWPGPEAAASLPPVNWRERWGGDFAENHAAFERAMRALSEDDYDRAREAGIARVPRLVEKLVAIGQRMRGRAARGQN